MAVRLAKLFADCGNEVILGSRTPDRAARIVHGLGAGAIKPGSYELAADAPVVLPSMFLRDGMLQTLEPDTAAHGASVLATSAIEGGAAVSFQPASRR